MIAKGNNTKERTIKVEFGGVPIGDGTARIGFHAQRRSTPLSEFDEMFCERRLTGSVHITASESDPSQQPLIDDAHDDVTISSTFDVKGYSVKAKTIGGGLAFALREIDTSLLAKYAKRSGFGLRRVALSHLANKRCAPPVWTRAACTSGIRYAAQPQRTSNHCVLEPAKTSSVMIVRRPLVITTSRRNRFTQMFRLH